ncbi:MAG: hypothetical protein MJ064_08115, partial [Lachnospiraceae bacterium]|nr:hypothetical protein [Lachnospiraceae bacterium]
NKTGLIIKNGTFDITWAVEEVLTEEAKENFVVSGGKFSVDVPNEYLAEGLATKLNQTSKYYELVTAVAAINDRTFASLTEAIAAVPTDGTETTVVLLTDSVGNGIKVLEGQNLILDFNTHSYNIDKTAEVSAAELTGFRLYENAKVTLKNGTLSTTSIFVADLIQNYADLTLVDMTLDGSKSPKLGYVISNITGRCDVLGNTSILAKKGKIAFDLCASSYYPAGVIINIDTTGTITGSIDYELWDSLTESNPTALTIKNGTFDIVWNVSDELTMDAAERFTVYGGRFTKDVPFEYLAPGHTTSFEDGYYVISPITDMITLTLGGAIGVNFYLNLDALKEIPSRIVIDELSFNSDEIAAAKVTEGAAEGFYLFTLPKYAKQMTDEIVCTMYDSEGNVMRTKSTSVKEIGEQYLTVYAEDEALTTLIKAMLHYGSMSQSYFDYNEDASAIDGIDVSELVIPEADVFNDYALTIDGDSTEMAFFGHSLLLNSKVTLRYYFMPMVDNLSEVSFTIDGTMVTPVVMSNGLCYIELTDIPAQELLTAHVASVGELSIAASAYSYAAGFFTQYERDPELEALLLAMYIYCQAAQAYMQ